jgi:hypothetical protein
MISGRHLALSVRLPGPRKARDATGLDAQALIESHAGNISAAARAAGIPRTTFRGLLIRGRLGRSS